MDSKYYSKINYLKSFIEFCSLTGNKDNFCKYVRVNGKKHELMKFKVYMELIDRGFEVLTEARFKNNLGVADIIAFSPKGDGYIFEIVNTETQESIDRKMNKYPIDFEIIVIKCSEPLEVQLTV